MNQYRGSRPTHFRYSFRSRASDIGFFLPWVALIASQIIILVVSLVSIIGLLFPMYRWIFNNLLVSLFSARLGVLLICIPHFQWEYREYFRICVYMQAHTCERIGVHARGHIKSASRFSRFLEKDSLIPFLRMAGTHMRRYACRHILAHASRYASACVCTCKRESKKLRGVFRKLE